MGHLEPSFQGDVAVVTGAASGIGLAVAGALCRAGAHVHGFDVASPETESGPLSEVGTLSFHDVDVRDSAAVSGAVADLLGREGKVDLLVNAAGIVRDRALWKLELEDWQAVIDVNLTGAFRVLRELAGPMRERRHGRIVQVASINGMRGKFGQASYSASKAALIGLTRTAARELGPRGVTVNAVAPGMIDTPMTRELPDEVRAGALAETALGRLGAPDDVVGAILFLLSEEAAHVTGTVLRVDGGQMS